MARKMTLPKIGVNMTEAVVAKWLVKPGDKISEGDAVIEAETDKSTQEIYATESGIVAKLLADEGQTVECNADIMVLVDEGEEYREEAAAPAKKEEPVVAPVTTAPAVSAPATRAAAPSAVPAGTRVRVSPLAKKIAQEQGIDFRMVPPAIQGGRIVKNDVLAFLANGGMTAQGVGENLEVISMSPMRKTIAARMTQSTLEKPCVGLMTTADATALLALRSKYKEKGVKISMDAILAKMAAKALTIHRNINTVLEGNDLLVKRDVNVGVAVDTQRGLMVPVVKNADKKSLVEVSENLSFMVEDVQASRLSPEAMSGGTFTITNLGMFGVEEFGPIINPPECCILGVGALKKEFVPDENDQPKLTTTFKMTLVFDHRIVDGAPAARFLKTLKEFVEMPELLI